jgi:tetratricopeptide (TPR) repeat protein
LLVDMLMPPERSKTREPRYAPAEALEQQADYAGALGEYLVIARIFPRDPAVLTRIGEMHMRLDEPREAVRWFERALVCIESAEKCLQVTNRLCTIYSRQLESPHETQRLLAEFIEKYPDTPYAVSVRERLARLRENGHRPCESG